MATNGGKIQFDVGFNVDKSGLNQITRSLREVQNAAASNKDQSLAKQFDQASAAAKKLEQIVNGSWNDKLNQLNLDKFNQSIKTSFGSVQNLKNQLVNGTAQGQAAFNSLASSVLNTNVQLRQSNTLLDKMATSMANTVKWGITASIFNKITGSIQSAYNYAKNLNSSLIDIRMVTGDSADQMQRFAKNANEVSQALGRSTLDYTKSAVQYYRQGLSDEQVAKRTEVTLKAQNVTGAGDQMVDYLTAVWNGFQINTQNAQAAVDSLAKVADSSASDLAELATAMSKVAATANVVGVDFDQLNAMIATVVATTRLAPESVGTAFKTIFARINDIRTGSDEAQISLGNYSGRMAELGINVLDASGRLRDTGDVITDIGNKWGELTKQQQTYLASTMGGQRQITQVMALFDNWSKYVNLLNTSLDANGTLNEKNNIYLESTAAHMQQLSTEAQRMYAALIDTDAINPLIDTLKGALSMFNNFIEGIGGGTNAFINLGATVANIFSKQIGTAISAQIQNIQRLKNNLAQIKSQQQWSQAALDTANISHLGTNDVVSNSALEKQAAITQRTLEVRRALSQEQYNYIQNLQRQVGVEQTRIDYLEQYQNISLTILDTENASSREFEQRLAIEQRTLQAEEEKANAVSRAAYFYRQYVDDEQQALNLAIALEQASNSELLTEEQKTRLSQLQKNLENGQKVTEEEIREILQMQNNAILRQKELVSQVKQGLQGKKAAQDGTLQKLKEQQTLRERTIKQQQDQAAQQLKIQGVVRGITGGVQAATAAVGGITEALDQTNSAAERLNGAWQGVSGTLGGIANVLMPGSGILVQGIMSLFQGTLKLFGIWDDIEWAIMSTQERVEKIDNALQSSRKQTSNNQKNIYSLKQAKEEYKELSALAGDYGQNINNLTDQQKQRYHELTNEFAQYNDAVVAGYDEQGNAIVKNNAALDLTIQKLQKEQEEMLKASIQEAGGAERILNTKDENARENYRQASSVAEYYQPDFSSWLPQGDYDQGPITTLREIMGQTQQQLNKSLEELDLDQSVDLFKTRVFEIMNEKGETIQMSIGEAFLNFQEILETGIDTSNYKTFSQIVTNIYKEIQDSSQNSTVVDSAQEILDQWESLISPIVPNVDQMLANLDQAQKDLADAQQDLQIGVSDLFDVIRAGGGKFSHQYQRLQKSGFTSSQLDNLIIQFLDGWSLSPTGEENIQEKIVESRNRVIQLGNDYIEDLLQILQTSNNNIQSKIKELDQQDFNNSDKVQGIIQNILSGLNIENFKDLQGNIDEDKIQALSDYLSSLLNIKLTLKAGEDGNLQIETFQFIPDEALAGLRTAVQNKLLTFKQEKFVTSTGVEIQLVPEQFDYSFLDKDQLGLVNENIENLNWGEYFRLQAEKGASAQQAFQTVVQDFLGDLNQLPQAPTQVSVDIVYSGFDSLTKNLEEGKTLKEDQLEFLQILQDQDEKLKELALTQGRGSQEYIEYLKTRKSLSERILKEQLKQQQENAEEKIKDLNIQLQKLDDVQANEAARQQLLQQIQNEQQKIINAKTEQNRISAILLSQEQQRAKELAKSAEEAEKTAQNILKLQTSQTQGDIEKVKNTKDTIEHLSDPTKDVTSDDYATLQLWMNRDPELARLAGEEQAGIFSDAFIARLTQLMGSDQESWLSDLYTQNVENIKEELSGFEKEYEENQSDLDAKTKRLEEINSLSAKEKEIAGTEEQQAKLEADINQLTLTQLNLKDQIESRQNALLQAESQQAEDARQVTEQAQKLLDIFTELSDKVMSQGLFGEGLEGQQLEKWNETLKQIGEEYADLQDAVIMLQHTELAGTQAYAQALGRVRAALNATTIQELVDKANAVDVNQLSEDLDISVNSEEFDTFVEQVEQFLEADKELNIEIHSQAQDDFERLSQELDDIYNTASKIGENFIVAADDLRELNQVFPGIIDGMQMLSDGSYQLRSDVVQNAIAAATQSTAADAQAVTTRLQAQASELRAKAAIYQSMADAAGRLASDQTMSAQQKAANIAIINKGQKDLQQENAEIAAKQQMDNYAAVTQNANANAGAAADAIASSASSQAQSVFQFAQNAIENYRQVGQAARDAANEEVTSAAPVPPGGIGSHFKGVSAVKGTAVSKQATSSNTGTSGSQNWAKLQTQYQAQADSLNAAANDIDGMIAQIGAKMGDMGSGLGNIASGYGKNGPSGKGGKGGGGGGGGGGNAKDPDFMQALEDQADRYHDIDIQIKHIADDLERLQDEQDKFIGKNLVKNLNEQLKVLNEQVAAYETKIELARQEADEVRNSLKSQGVTFAADGDISNYASALYNKLASVNKVINHYNNLSAEAQEGYKDTVEAAKQEYEDFKAQIERYDELISEVIPDLEKSIRDSINKQIEVNIAKFKIKVDLELDLSKAERDWNKFRKKVIDQIRKDDVLGNVSATFRDMFSYYKDGYDVIQSLTDQVLGTLEQLYSIDNTGTSSIYGDNQAQALEDLKNYMNQLMSNLEDIEDLVDDIKDSIFDAIDDAQDAFDEQVDEFEFISDLIDHDAKLLELLYGDDAYQSLDKYYALQQDNNNKQLDFLRQQKQLWYDRMMLEQNRMSNLPQGSNAWKEANDRLEEYKKHWMDATKDLNKLVESSVQTLTDKYGNIVDKIFNDFNDKMTGGKGLDYVEEEWELINKQADMYLDKVNSMYEIDKLENAYRDAIKDNDGNLAAQRSLNDMMEEQLKYLKDKDKLTQYDVDRANALLQIEIKRLALEQTRQNKTKLRLRRDSQGNYTYQYVANEEETSEAEQDLADARNSLYNLTKEAYKSNLDSFYDMTTEWQDKVKDVYKDTTLTVEEQQQKVMLLNEYYGDMINGLLEQNQELKRFMMQDTFDELAEMYGVDVTNFQDMTNEEKDILMDEMIPYWDSGIQEMEDRFAGQGGFVPTVQGSMRNLDQATKDYQDSLDDLASTAGIDFEDIRNGIDETILQTQDLLENNEQLIDSYENELDAVQRVIDQVDDLTTAYNNARNAAIAASQAAYEYQQAQRNVGATSPGAISSYSGGTQNIYGTSTSTKTTSTAAAEKVGGAATGAGSGTGGGGTPTSGSTLGNYYNTIKTSSPISTSNRTIAGTTNASSASGVLVPIGYDERTKKKIIGTLAYSMDTGGYTGDWAGEDGRVALLHKRELVLNATDTKNILDAVNIVRDINAMVNGLNSGISMFDSAGAGSSTTLDQNVHITAQFPGVTQHTEIEKAFENLVNRASQFAFNTKR